MTAFRIGLTGGIAAGKTAVADRLAGHGAMIIDADRLARDVVGIGTDGLAEVVGRFGSEILSADGSLDRAAMGRLVFADVQARRDLERIIHPRVRARAAQLEQAASGSDAVVHVIPLLVETGQARDFDLLVVVDADPQAQVQRLGLRDGLDQQAAQARLLAQADRAERLAAADVVIPNHGTTADLMVAVDRLWDELIAPRLAGWSAGA